MTETDFAQLVGECVEEIALLVPLWKVNGTHYRNIWGEETGCIFAVLKSNDNVSIEKHLDSESFPRLITDSVVRHFVRRLKNVELLNKVWEIVPRERCLIVDNSWPCVLFTVQSSGAIFKADFTGYFWAETPAQVYRRVSEETWFEKLAANK